jgi:hypothetical protein
MHSSSLQTDTVVVPRLIWRAALQGDWGDVLTWCDQCPSAATSIDTLGNTLLHYACGLRGHCNEPTVQWLLQHGAPWAAPCSGYHGGTAVHIAARSGTCAILQVLARHGASLTAPGVDGCFTPLHSMFLLGYTARWEAAIEALQDPFLQGSVAEYRARVALLARRAAEAGSLNVQWQGVSVLQLSPARMGSLGTLVRAAYACHRRWLRRLSWVLRVRSCQPEQKVDGTDTGRR